MNRIAFVAVAACLCAAPLARAAGPAVPVQVPVTAMAFAPGNPPPATDWMEVGFIGMGVFGYAVGLYCGFLIGRGWEKAAMKESALNGLPPDAAEPFRVNTNIRER